MSTKGNKTCGASKGQGGQHTPCPPLLARTHELLGVESRIRDLQAQAHDIVVKRDQVIHKADELLNETIREARKSHDEAVKEAEDICEQVTERIGIQADILQREHHDLRTDLQNRLA